MENLERPPEVPEGALRLKITVQYITGEEEEFFSWHPPRFKDDGGVLIKTDVGVVRIESQDLMRVKHTACMPNL